MRRLLVAIVLASLVVSGPAAAEQYDRPPGSIFAAFNLGAGWGRARVDTQTITVAESATQTGALWGFRVGRALSEVVVLGIDYVGYHSVTDDPAVYDEIESEFWVIGPSLSWYPSSTGFFIKGSAGWGGVKFRVVENDAAARAEDSGLGLVGSIGYEIPVNARLSLGIQLDYVWMSVNEVQVANGIGGREDADLRFDTWGLSAFVMLNY
jgi:hypothetical protein